MGSFMTRVAMYPASVRSNDNPFITILVSGMREAGVDVVPFNAFSTRDQADALHVHWLEQVLWGRISKRIPAFAMWLARRLIRAAASYRANGKPVVWTVHNLRPHEGLSEAHQAIFRELRSRLLPLVTDVILMSEAIAESVATEYPEVALARRHLFPLPHYRTFFDAHRPLTDVRALHGIPKDVPLLVVVGMLRRYKGVPELIRAARAVSTPFAMLIAGDGDAATCRDVAEAIGDDERFVFDRRRLSHGDVGSALAAADVAVFNFTDVLNSSSVMAALSMSTPVVCPRSASLVALEDELGLDWVRCFSRPIAPAVLGEALERSTAMRHSECALRRFDPVEIGRLHRGVYAGNDERSPVQPGVGP